MAALTIPIVALVGSSLVGLKLVALAWSALGLIAWTLLIDRWWGRRAAQIFAFLFVFAPPLFVTYNLIAMGSHAEVVTLAGVQLLLAYRYLYDRRSLGALVAWAACAGFGTWFTYASIVPFLFCIAVGLAGGSLPLRHWAPLVGAFLAGFAPWIATNLVSGGRGLDVVVRTFGGGAHAGSRSLAATLESIRYLIHTGIPLGLQYPEVLAGLTGGAPRRLLLPHLYFALYALSYIVLLRDSFRREGLPAGPASTRGPRAWARSHPELPLLALFPGLVLLLAVSDQVFLQHELVPFLSFRLLVPFLPPVFATMAIVVARLPATLRWLVLLVLAFIGVAGTIQGLTRGASDRSHLTTEARTIGAQAMGHLLYYKHAADVPLITERIGVAPEELRGPAWEGFGFSLAYHFAEDQPIEAFTQVVLEVPRRFQGDVVRGIQMALGPGMEQVKPIPPSPRTAALLAAVVSLDPLGSGQ
jgi:hypothetical protein